MNNIAEVRYRPYTFRLTLIKKIIFHSINVMLTFGLIFNLVFSAVPALSTGRVTLLILLAMYGKDTLNIMVKFARQYTVAFTTFLLLLLFSMAWLVVNGVDDAVMFSRAFWFLIFTVLSSFLYARMCRFNFSTAMLYYLVAMLIQAFFVFNSVLNPEFRGWVDQTLVNAGNIDFSDGVRFAGLSNGGGAGLSLALGLGVVASVALFSQSQSNLGKLVLVLAAIIITIATVFVGRTGLYLSLLMLLGFILLSGRSLLIPILLVIVTWLASTYILSASSDGVQLEGNDIKLDRTVNWAFELFMFGESSSSDALVSALSKLRELTVTNLIIGSGRISELDGSNYSGHDSGYLHSLYALGLPLSLIFYIVLFGIYWKMLQPVQGVLKKIGLVLIALVFILELKEPFIFKYTLPFFVLVYCYLAQYKFLEKGIRENTFPY